MTTPILITSVICVIATIVFLAYYFNPHTVILRTLKKLPFSRIASLQNHNYTKIQGKATSVDQALEAPLSKRKCVYYKMKIEKRVSSGKTSHWKTILTEEKIQDFFVEQTGDRLLILPKDNPKNYSDYLITDKIVKPGIFNDPSEDFLALLKKNKITSKGLFGFNKQLRYQESCIEIGEKITVAGVVKWMELENPVSNYNSSRVATLMAKDKQKILITDSPKALDVKR